MTCRVGKVLVFLVFLIVWLPVWGAEALKPLRWGYLSFPPRMLADASGQPSGELAEIIKSILNELKIPYQALVYPNRRLLVEVLNENIDFTLLTKPQVDNPSNFLFSDTIFGCIVMHSVWIARSTQPVASAWALKGKNIVAIHGFRYGGVLDQIQPKSITRVNGHRLGLEALRLGRGDYLLGYKNAILSLTEDNKNDELGLFPILSIPVYAVLKKQVENSQMLISRIDELHRSRFNEHFERYRGCIVQQLPDH